MPASRPRPPVKNTVAPKSMTAAAERLADRLASKAGNSQIGEAWQRLALEMYDAVPELRAAARITGQTMSQCRLVIARVTDGEPAPLDVGTPEKPGPDANHPAQRLLDGFAGGAGGQSAWLDATGVFLTVTGETISIGAVDTTTENDSPVAEWTAYSPEQVVSRNKVITVKTGDSAQTDHQVDEKDEGVVAVRIWRPHPRFNWRADSPAKAALTAMQEIILYDQHIEASAISRLISAGIFAVPDGMTLPGLAADEDSEDADVDPFMRFLMQVMSTAIQDRTSAAARVPILIRGDKEDIAAMQHFTFDTPFSDKVLELRNAAIGRLAVAMDMPAAMLTGMEDLQHWTGALITQDWVNNYLQAQMNLICGSLTSGWLHPALTALQGAGDYGDLIVWFDSSAVRVRENIGPEAQWLWENALISDDAIRRVFGMDDSDVPSQDEINRHLLLQMLHKAPVLAPLVFPLLGFKFTVEQLAEAEQLGAALHHVLGAPDTGGKPTGTNVPVGPGGAQAPGSTGTTPSTSPSGKVPSPQANPADGNNTPGPRGKGGVARNGVRALV